MSDVNHRHVWNDRVHDILHLRQWLWLSCHYNFKMYPYYSCWVIQILRNLAWQQTIIKDSCSISDSRQDYCAVNLHSCPELWRYSVLYCHVAPSTLQQLNYVNHTKPHHHIHDVFLIHVTFLSISVYCVVVLFLSADCVIVLWMFLVLSSLLENRSSSHWDCKIT